MDLKRFFVSFLVLSYLSMAYSGQDKDIILDTLIRTTAGGLSNWLGSLPRVSENDYPDTKPIRMFRDDADNCYVIFCFRWFSI